MDRKALIEKIFDKLDINKEGSLKLDNLDKILLNVNEANRHIIEKYVKKYQNHSKNSSITKLSFTNLLTKKNNPHVVHVKLSELLDYKVVPKSPESFADRVKQRLSLPKYNTVEAVAIENKNAPKGKPDTLYESHEKIRNKSSKERNLEELLSIRRCHLLYSLLE